MMKRFLALLLPGLFVAACADTSHHSASALGGTDAGATQGGGMSSAGKASSGGSSASEAGAPSDPGPATDADSFFAADAHAFCARLFRCFESGSDDFSATRLALQTQQRCEDFLLRLFSSEPRDRDLRAQIATKNLRYLPEQAQKCLTELSACNGSLQSAGACREVFEGSAKSAEACTRSEDCAGDAYCDSSLSCPGTCAPRKSEGQACKLDTDCAYTEGAVFCNRGDNGMGTCHTLSSSPKVGLGMPCTRNLTGAPSLIVCSDELWCAALASGDPSHDALGQCAAPLAMGSACVHSDDVCVGGLCDTVAGMCQAYTLHTKAGDPCDKQQLVFCDPLANLVCGPDGKCLAAGDGSEGKSCFTSELQWGCDPGLYCQKPAGSLATSPGTCQRLLADQAPCDSDDSCESAGCIDMVCGKRACYP